MNVFLTNFGSFAPYGIFAALRTEDGRPMTEDGGVISNQIKRSFTQTVIARRVSSLRSGPEGALRLTEDRLVASFPTENGIFASLRTGLRGRFDFSISKVIVSRPQQSPCYTEQTKKNHSNTNSQGLSNYVKTFPFY